MGDLSPRLRLELQSDIKLNPNFGHVVVDKKEGCFTHQGLGCELKGKLRGQEIEALNLC